MKRGIDRILAKLSDVTELPLNELCKDFSANILGRREITVEGVLSIYSYESDCIILEVCGDRVYIIGEKLVLKNFYHSTLCVGGVIKKVEIGG